MKILQINTVYAIKSTGRTCAEVEQALAQMGHESCTAYGNGKKESSPNAYQIDTKIEYLFHNFMSRLTGLEGYFSIFATLRLIKYIQKFQPDIIHLRNLHGHYLNFSILFNYLAKTKIPIIQNLHDCWAFTGKCTYYTTINCQKWKTECSNCPKMKEYPQSWFFDWSKKMRKNKEKWYSSLDNLTVVGVSDWVTNEAKMSFFSKAKNITRIYNWINMDVFHPYEYSDCLKEKYNIPKDKFMILGVSSIWASDTPRFEDFMYLAEHISDDMVLVMIGACRNNDLVDKNVVHIPFVDDTTELARLYSSANVYIHCSREDTFGKVIAEALACGTPAVVYEITGCPEIVKEGCGFTVAPRDVNGIIKSINIIKSNGKENYTDNCLKNTFDNFNYQNNIQQLIDLYLSLVVKKNESIQMKGDK